MSIDVNIKRINNFEYSFQYSTRKGMRCIAEALTFHNPDPFAYSHRIEKFNKRNFTFKIGMLSTLEKYIQAHNMSYQISDYDFSFPKEIEIDSRMTGRYIHQQRAVEAFFKKRFGIIVVPTRGGKTFIASEILRIFLNTNSGNFLFLVDNITLYQQAINDIKEYFQVYGGIEIGEIKSGQIDTTKRVTVGMIQTIQSTFSERCRDKNKKKELDKYIKTLKFLCVDEIHDNCSDAKLKTYKKAKQLEYQLCLSATPYRSGTLVQNLKLQEWSGDVIYTISEETLRERGVLSEYRVFLLFINHEKENVDSDEYSELRKELIFSNEKRNNVLFEIVSILKKMNLKTLLLFQSVEHGLEIEKLFKIPFISGSDNEERRTEEKEKFLKEEGGFLCASNIFKKGVTLPEVQVLINVDGGLEDSNTIQKKGRVLGTTEDKRKSLIIDFFDFYHLYFSEHSKTRLKTYVDSIGKNNVEVFDIKIPQWKEDIENKIEKWFKSDNYSDMQ